MAEEDIILRIDRWQQQKHYSIDKLGKEMPKESEKGGWHNEELLGYRQEEERSEYIVM